MHFTRLLFASLFFVSAICHADTWTDPAVAGKEDPAFLIQGEYGVAESGQAWGAHIIAMGEGNFDAYLLEGGLPGLGYTREKARTKLTGKSAEGKTSLQSEDGKLTATIAGGKITLQRDGKPLAELARVERKSSTLGEKPPAGAIVLFDGSSADEWNKPEALQDGLLANLDISTKRKFHSYKLHLEFRTPYKPKARGQGRGNSGVYHQHRYETQVLDSFGLTGEYNETGGIYTISKPIVNSCLPPLQWQTYDVDFTTAEFDESGKLVKNARMTVHLNGVLVQDDTDLPKTTGGAKLKITPEPGPIYIQHHGNPVFYRNIWVVEK